MGGHATKPIDFVRKSLIVIVLFIGVLGLHHYAETPQNSTLLALGFVVLAAYLIGELVEVIKLPHITGYLLCGLALGPSVPKTLQSFHVELIPPFDHGILNENVIGQLGILNTLALPLICLTAGGALNPKAIKKALRPITGILLGQIVTMFIGIIALFYLMSLDVPLLHMNVLGELTLPAVLAIGGVVAAISLATSDAATIAIVVSSKAKGPMTTNIISVAVLKDVVVVIAFSAMTTLAIAAMPEIESTGSLGSAIFNIFLSAIAGCGLGWLLHLYLKYVGVETLLFLTGLIYTVSFVADQLHLESALMFIAAGFVAANWSSYGDKLISEVERLSAPVFVVFFTLAGAKLHLDEVANMALFAMMLVGIRAAAFYIGVRIGATISKADEGSRKYSWMGFVSQAGLAITLADSVKNIFPGELGSALYSFILAGVAVNEIIGPAMLQAALSLAGEIPGEAKRSTTKEDSPPEQRQREWKDIQTKSIELAAIHKETQAALSTILNTLHKTVIETRRQEIDALLTQLNRRAKGGSLDLYKRQAMRRLGQNNLVSLWTPNATIMALDKISDQLSDSVAAPWETESLSNQAEDGKILRLQKKFARLYNQIRPLKRNVDARSAARFHFSGQLPLALIAFGELAVEKERDLISHLQHEKNDSDLIAALQNWRKGLHDLDDLILGLFSEAHARFGNDLIILSTPSLPAWKRRFGLTFHQRNTGLAALTIDKAHVDSLVEARWNKGTAELDFGRFKSAAKRSASQFCQPMLMDLKAHYERLQTMGDALNQWMIDSREELKKRNPKKLDHLARDMEQMLLSETEKAKKLLNSFQSEANWKTFNQDLSRTTRAFSETITLPTDDQSTQWTQLQNASIASLPLRDYATGNVETQFQPRIRKAMERYLNGLMQSISLSEDLRRIIDFNLNAIVKDIDNTSFETMEEMLLHATERVHKRLIQVIDKEKQPNLESNAVDSAINSSIGAMHRLIFIDLKPQRPTEQPKISSSLIVGSIAKQVKKLIIHFKPLSPTKKSRAPSDVYLRLFDASRADAQTLPSSRAAFRDQLCADLEKNKSILLLGRGIEVQALADNIAENMDALLVKPTGLITVESLQRDIEQAGKKPIIFNGLHWLFKSPDLKSDALEWVVQQLYEHTWLIVSEPEIWDMIKEKMPLPKDRIKSLPELNEKDLKEAILSRHQLSGYDIVFPNPSHWRTAFRIWAGGGDAEKDWFKQLMIHSRGDLEEAFLLWTEGIEKIDDDNGVMTMDVIGPRSTQIVELEDWDLILMRQILKQGWITVELGEHWFLCSRDWMKTKLTSIEKMGLLIENEGYWTLGHGIREPLRRRLKQKGWS